MWPIRRRSANAVNGSRTSPNTRLPKWRECRPEKIAVKTRCRVHSAVIVVMIVRDIDTSFHAHYGVAKCEQLLTAASESVLQ